MSVLTNRLIKAAMATAVLATAATCANATQFKLTLPMQAQWGQAVLPAGDYIVSTSDNSSALRVSGNGKTVSVLVASSEYGHVSSSHIRVVDVNGTAVVKELTSAAFDKTYTFLVPRASSVHGSLTRTVAFTVGNQKQKQ
jgi:hypothetical protein